jgi:hypothetical protein
MFYAVMCCEKLILDYMQLTGNAGSIEKKMFPCILSLKVIRAVSTLSHHCLQSWVQESSKSICDS